jgi:hypothetical protein
LGAATAVVHVPDLARLPNEGEGKMHRLRVPMFVAFISILSLGVFAPSSAPQGSHPPIIIKVGSITIRG